MVRKLVKNLLKKLFDIPFIQNQCRYSLDQKLLFVSNTTKDQKDIIRKIKNVRKQCRIGMTDQEAYILYNLAKNTAKVPGAMVEVGVFEGGTALLATEVKAGRELYLFDTFSGLPHVDEIDKEFFHEGQFVASYESVCSFFKDDSKVTVAKGIFPQETGNVLADKKFSFVHLDVDTFQGTKDSLEFIYLRVNSGGAILVHDYGTAPGVRKAVSDFLIDKPEIVIEPSYSQAVIIKA